MNKSKWSYKLITVAALVCVGLGTWYFISTKEERAYSDYTRTLTMYAQRQAIEIAIIEQASKLTDYRNQIAQAQQQSKQNVVNQLQEIADPKDVDVNK